MPFSIDTHKRLNILDSTLDTKYIRLINNKKMVQVHMKRITPHLKIVCVALLFGFHVTLTSGLPTCVTDPPGYSADDCVCGLGLEYKVLDGIEQCLPCSDDQFKSAHGDTDCMDIPPNAIRNFDGTDFLCLPTYGRDQFNMPCDPCPEDTYQSTVSGTPCKPRTLNSVINSDHSDFLCLPGYERINWTNVHPNLNLRWNPTAGVWEEYDLDLDKWLLFNYACVTCPENTYKSTTGNEICTSCSENSISLSNRTECICEAGYEHVEGTCSSCSFNTYKSFAGNENCISCLDNSISSSNRTECICEPGYEYVEGTCSSCSSGTYKSFTGNENCISCLENSISSSDYTECICETGYEPASTGVIQSIGITCSPCPLNTYKAAYDNVNCTDCRHGSVTTSTGSNAQYFCKCAKGFYNDPSGTATDDCQECPTGTFKDTDANLVPCTNCPTGYTTLAAAQDEAGDCSVCLPGYFPDTLCTDELNSDESSDNYGTPNMDQWDSTCSAYVQQNYCADGSDVEYSPGVPYGSWLDQGRLHCCACGGGHIADICSLCAAGKYKSSTGSETCTDCPVGSSSPTGSDASTDCVCQGPAFTGPDGGPCVCSPGYFISQLWHGVEYLPDECQPCPSGNYCPGGIEAPLMWCPENHVSAPLSANETDCLCGMGTTCSQGAACVGAPTCIDPVSFPVYGERWRDNYENYHGDRLTYYAVYETRAGIHAREFIDFRDKDGWNYKGWKIPMGETDGTTQLDDWVLAAYGGYPTEICNNPMDNLPCYITADVSESNGWECHRDGFPDPQPVESCPYQAVFEMQTNICPSQHNYLGGCHSGSGQLATDPITGAGPRDYFFDVYIAKSVDENNAQLQCNVHNAVLRIFGRNWYPFGVLVSKHDIWSFLDPDTNPHIDAFYEYGQTDSGECDRLDFGSRVNTNNYPSWSATAVHILSGLNCQDTSVCEVCGANTYKDVLGAQACIPCPENTQSPAQSTSLSACVANAGFYLDASQNNIAVACSSGMTSAVGSTSVSDCTCMLGHRGTSCVACEAGKYKDILGPSECSNCKDNSNSTVASTTEDDCLCNIGYYFTNVCFDLPAEHDHSLAWYDSYVCSYTNTCDDYEQLNWCATEGHHDWCASLPTGSANDKCCACGGGEYRARCVACEAGQYNEISHSSACLNCPSNSNSPTASDEATDCSCNVGYAGENGGTCTACEAGKYAEVTGSLECLLCPANSTSPTASSDITACVCNGGYAGTDGSTCTACAENYYEDTFNHVCVECAVNFVSPSTSNDNADCQCEAGYYETTSCIDLPAEHDHSLAWYDSYACWGVNTCDDYVEKNWCVSDGHYDWCASLPTGSAQDKCCGCGGGDITRTCIECPANTYKDVVGNSACTTCPAHSESPEGSVNVDECLCAAGYFINNGLCDPCDVGTYTDTTDNDACSVCPDDSTTPGTGSTSLSDCSCNSGYSGINGGACTICPANTYEDISTNTCTNCPDNTVSNEGSFDVSDCQCSYGFMKLFTDTFVSNLEDCGGLPSNPWNANHGTCELFASNGQDQGKYKGFSGWGNDNDYSTNIGLYYTDCFDQCYYERWWRIDLGPDIVVNTVKLISSDNSVSYSSDSDSKIYIGNDIENITNNMDCGTVGEFTSVNEALTVTCNGNSNNPTHRYLWVFKEATPTSDSRYMQWAEIEISGWRLEVNSECSACAPGKYKDTIGSTACSDCPQDSTCIYSTATSLLDLTCNAGYTLNVNECSACPTGTYKPTPGSDACTDCPNNSISPSVSTAETDCVCNAGYTGPDGGECVPCEADKYKDFIGSSACLDCTLYSTSPTGSDNVTDCICDPGYFHAGDGSCDRVCAAGFEANLDESSCLGCGNSHYKPSQGDESCTPCPAFSSHSLYNQTSMDACICQHGYIFNSETESCDACEAGKFNNYGGETRCFDCFSDTSGNCIASDSGTESCTDICQAPTGYQIRPLPPTFASWASSYFDLQAGESPGFLALDPMTLGQNQIYDASPFSIDMSTGFTGIFSLNHGNTNSWAYFLNFRDSNTNNRIILQRTTSWNGWNFYIQNAGGGDVCNVQTSQNFIKNAWYHVILRKSANSLNLDVMYNGDTFSYSVACTTTFENSMDLAHVGALSNGPSFSLNAFLFIDQHLTDSEVETIVQKMDTLHIPGYPPQDTTSSNLEICPANTYNDGSFTTCQTCPTGTYTSETGSSAVTDCLCQPGYFMNSSSLCGACAVGTFKSTVEDVSCSVCPADMTTLSTASTSCVCAAGFEPNADNTACQACPQGQAKYVAGNASCIQCIDHATLQNNLPHQQSSCLCNPGYTGNHLSCSACDTGTFKDSHGTASCTPCVEHATTSNSASTSITECSCIDSYISHQTDGGPDQIGGSCIQDNVCPPGSQYVVNTCEACPEGFYKDTSGGEACTPCPSPRNASNTGSDNINDCSCRPGEIALAGATATIDSIQGFLDSTSTTTCTAMPCVINSNHELPLKHITISSSMQSLTVHIRTAGTSLLVYKCQTAHLCSGLSNIPLPSIRVEYVDIVATSTTPSIFNHIQLHSFTHADATFSNTDHAWWNLAEAQALIINKNMQSGESIFDTAAVFDDTLCTTCAQGLVCAEFIV